MSKKRDHLTVIPGLEPRTHHTRSTQPPTTLPAPQLTIITAPDKHQPQLRVVKTNAAGTHPSSVQPSPINYSFTDPVLRDAHYAFQHSERARPTALDSHWVRSAQEEFDTEHNAAYVRAADQLLSPFDAYMLDNGDVYTKTTRAISAAEQEEILEHLHEHHICWDEEAEFLLR